MAICDVSSFCSDDFGMLPNTGEVPDRIDPSVCPLPPLQSNHFKRFLNRLFVENNLYDGEKRRQEEPNESSFGAKIRCAPVALQVKKGFGHGSKVCEVQGRTPTGLRGGSPHRRRRFPTPPARPPPHHSNNSFSFHSTAAVFIVQPSASPYCISEKRRMREKRWHNTQA
ncbi:hypothetical protein CEXT_323031 [Caerostris extrusa]|uniref:Uncharacterized protein n=1 Tax=Caerostris extrusa TaxID=172846 RepID=A0AAV4N1C9_CAEEX|nr:hypothetical protein CEXT_323031 [Caerostris extrusa]